VKRSTWVLLESVLAELLERRRRLEAETIEVGGEVLPAEGWIAEEWFGKIPPVESPELAKALEDLRDSEVFD